MKYTPSVILLVAGLAVACVLLFLAIRTGNRTKASMDRTIRNLEKSNATLRDGIRTQKAVLENLKESPITSRPAMEYLGDGWYHFDLYVNDQNIVMDIKASTREEAIEAATQ